MKQLGTRPHAHDHAALTGIDTDQSSAAIHHSLGSGATQAASGTHTHQIPSPGVTTQDEGTQQGTAQTTLNFVGAGVQATAAGTTTTVTVPGTSGMSDPTTTVGDLIFRNASNAITRFPVGADGQKIVSIAGVPTYRSDLVIDARERVGGVYARWDNFTDDTAACQPFINALPATGGTVTHPSGTSLISAPVIVDRAMRNVGQGGIYHPFNANAPQAGPATKVRWTSGTATVMFTVRGRECPVWTPNTTLATAKTVQPTVPNGYQYRVSATGTTGATEPVWPTTLGGTVTFTEWGAPDQGAVGGVWFEQLQLDGGGVVTRAVNADRLHHGGLRAMSIYNTADAGYRLFSTAPGTTDLN